jgi:uncharacterized OB-fold protein
MSTVRSTTRPPSGIRITTDTVTEGYWRAAQDGRLVAPRCTSCGTFRFPPTPFCPSCQHQEIDWIDLGQGTIFSFSIVRGLPDQPDDVIVAAVIEFADAPGVHVVSNIVDADPDAVHIGDEVTVDFIEIADGWKLPVFRLTADR